MKLAQTFIFLGVVVAGLICEHAPGQAQPASGPAADQRGPAPPDSAPTPSDDESSASDGESESIVDDDPDSPWSKGVSAEERRVARDQFREGNRLYMVPLYARAVEQYTAALRKWKHPGVYYNLALAQLSLGKDIEARENLDHALAHGEKPLGAKRFRNAQKQLAEVKRRLGRIRVICQTPGAEVTMDGVTLFIGPGSYEGWTKAKTHEITAKKAGFLSEARTVTVASEQLQSIELKLVTLGEATDTSRRWAVWKPWAVVAAGGAIAAASGALHALAARNFSTYDDQFLQLPCVTMPDPAAPGCAEADVSRDLNDRLSRARRQQTIAVGGYLAGGSLIAAGVVLLYLNRPQLAEGAAGSPPGGVAIEPAVSSDMLGFVVRVSQ